MDNDSSWCWAAHAWQRLDKNLTLMVWEYHGIETNRWHIYIYIFIYVIILYVFIHLYVHLASYCFAWTCCYSVFEAYIYIYIHIDMSYVQENAAGNSSLAICSRKQLETICNIDLRVPAHVNNYIHMLGK